MGMAETVYILCTLTSIACTVLLWRGYRRTSTRLLFWSSLCFVGFAINNVLLLVDLQLWHDDLSLYRNITGLAGAILLVFGLVWEQGS